MSQPDTGDVHVNSLLSQMSVGYANAANAYVADRAAPPVYVSRKSDLYAVYNRGDFFADHGDEMIRAPGTRAATTGFGVTNQSYNAINYAIGMLLPDELLANADEVFQLEQDALRLVTELQLIRREREFAATAMATSVWATDNSTATNWDNYGSSDPLGDMATAGRIVTQTVGATPNVAVMGQIVFDRLRFHPDIMELIKYGGGPSNPAMITEEMLSGIFGLEVLVSRAQFRESQEGEATLNLDPIIDDDLLLLHREPNPSRFTPSNLVNFVWASAVLEPSAPHFIRRWRDDPAKVVQVESQSYFDMTVTDAESTGPAGYFFTDIVD